MEKSVKITAIIAGTILVIALLGFVMFQSSKPAVTVTASGTAEIKALPDLVTIYFNVQTEARTSQEANDNNSVIVDNLITAILKLGFERKDIVTENFNIYPQYDWNGETQTLTGYQATHSIKVQLSASQMEKIGSVIDAGVNAGALISYINFELSLAKQNEYKAQALEQATEDAKSKVTSIALGTGKKLGKLISISDSSFNYYPWPLYASASGGTRDTASAKQAVTSIQPGQQTVSAQVSAVYEIV